MQITNKFYSDCDFKQLCSDIAIFLKHYFFNLDFLKSLSKKIMILRNQTVI